MLVVRDSIAASMHIKIYILYCSIINEGCYSAAIKHSQRSDTKVAEGWVVLDIVGCRIKQVCCCWCSLSPSLPSELSYLTSIRSRQRDNWPLTCSIVFN